jgi:hypothetical protein
LDKARSEAVRRPSKARGDAWPGREALYDAEMAERRLGAQ